MISKGIGEIRYQGDPKGVFKEFFFGEIRKKFKHFQSDFIVDIFNHEHIKDHPSVAKIVHIKIIDFAGKLRCFFLVVERRGNPNHFSSRWNHPKTYLPLQRKKEIL